MIFKCKKCKQTYNNSYYNVCTYGDNGICLRCQWQERKMLKSLKLYSDKTLIASPNPDAKDFIIEIDNGNDVSYRFKIMAYDANEVRHRIWHILAEEFPEIDLSFFRISKIY